VVVSAVLWLRDGGNADTGSCRRTARQGLHKDADIYRLRLNPGQIVTHNLAPGRGAWLHVAEGVLTFNGVELAAGDAASTEEPGTLTFTASQPTKTILFDLN
jgi:quercetin 2,3-dioxygenase